MNTKLILVEGLPSSGKSTTACIIRDILVEMNVETELFLEGNLNHPADYDGVACFTEDEVLSMNNEYKDMLMKYAVKKENNYFFSYQKIKNETDVVFSDELINKIYANDIYELPLERNIELITERWKEFSKQAMAENKVYIFECCFMQNPLTVGMVKHNASKEIVMNYISRLADIIEPLNPILMYVEQRDLQFSFKKAIKERANEWSKGFIHYYTSQGYGKEHHYTGIGGTLKVLEARRELELEIFNLLAINKYKIDNSQYEKDKYILKLKGILDKVSYSRA